MPIRSHIVDGAGNRTRLTHPNGTSTDYAYLTNTWLASITDKTPGGSAFQSVSYGYDPNGNRTSQADSSGTTAFEYDELNRLKRAAYPGTFGTWTWRYDAVGNRIEQTAPPGAVLPGYGAIPPLTTYTYDGTNRLTQANSTTYSYDHNGNLLSISTGQTFTWDVFNRMTQATGPGGTVTHTYSGDGLKTRRVGPDGTRLYYSDGIRPIYETDATGALLMRYDRDVFGNLLNHRDPTGGRRYYHHDGLGSTTALTDATGAVAATMLYDAWGNQRAAMGSGHGRYRFTGAERDEATGLYHMGARFYDPVIGRWLSEDPVQDKLFEPATLNFYAYVFNNPVLLTDPRGTDPLEDSPDYSSGPTPEGVKRAAERLQEFINALNELNALIEAMISQGITSIMVGRGQVSLATVMNVASGLASQFGSFITLREFVRNLYEASGYVGTIGVLVFMVGVVVFAATRNPTMAWAGLGLIFIGGAMKALAWSLDQLFFRGEILREAQKRNLIRP